jgi:lysophospholipase L1-like esterase
VRSLNKRWLGAVVLGLSLGFACLAAEVGLRVVSKHWLRVYDVEMWRYARLIKTISPYPGVVEEQRANGSALLMGVQVHTDERGFRLPDPATLARRRAGDRVVVALGDSLTFGWGVPEGLTFPDQLERLLAVQCAKGAQGAMPGADEPPRGARRRGATVLNAGIGNCNTSMEVQRYKLRIRPFLHPDWLILGFSFNDAEPDPVPNTNPFFWHSALLSLAGARLEKSADPKLANYNAYYLDLFREGQPGWEHTKAALRELGALLRADGIPATLFLIPELHDPHDPGIAAAFSRVAAIGRQAGFEVIDPVGAFPPGSGERYWVSHEDAHPNAAAQTLLAHALARSRYACASR